MKSKIVTYGFCRAIKAGLLRSRGETRGGPEDTRVAEINPLRVRDNPSDAQFLSRDTLVKNLRKNLTLSFLHAILFFFQAEIIATK